jgi:hypothetical protein
LGAGGGVVESKEGDNAEGRGEGESDREGSGEGEGEGGKARKLGKGCDHELNHRAPLVPKVSDVREIHTVWPKAVGGRSVGRALTITDATE